MRIREMYAKGYLGPALLAVLILGGIAYSQIAGESASGLSWSQNPLTAMMVRILLHVGATAAALYFVVMLTVFLRNRSRLVLFHSVCALVVAVAGFFQGRAIQDRDTEERREKVQGFLSHSGHPWEYWGFLCKPGRSPDDTASYCYVIPADHHRFDEVVVYTDVRYGCGVIGLREQKTISRMLNLPSPMLGYVVNDKKASADELGVEVGTSGFLSDVAARLTPQETAALGDLMSVLEEVSGGPFLQVNCLPPNGATRVSSGPLQAAGERLLESHSWLRLLQEDPRARLQ
jgi:hypothetical protein